MNVNNDNLVCFYTLIIVVRLSLDINLLRDIQHLEYVLIISSSAEN